MCPLKKAHVYQHQKKPVIQMCDPTSRSINREQVDFDKSWSAFFNCQKGPFPIIFYLRYFNRETGISSKGLNPPSLEHMVGLPAKIMCMGNTCMGMAGMEQHWRISDQYY